MDDSNAWSLEQIRAFLAGSGEVRFAGQRREEIYAWVEQTLVRHQYASVDRPGKGLVRSFIARMTGLSRAQVTRRSRGIARPGGSKRQSINVPFWSHPIPKFVANQGGTTPADLSYVATLELGKYSFDPKGSVGRYTGKDGAQQSAEELIWSLPNGLQGYALFGAWNQRRVDAFTQIVRDPRVQRYADDTAVRKLTGTGASGAIMDHRLNNASSCMGCHIDGMNRANNGPEGLA